LRNELTEKDIRQKKPGSAGLFFFDVRLSRCCTVERVSCFSMPVFLRGTVRITGNAVRASAINLLAML
jgi:hypothetical protein